MDVQTTCTLFSTQVEWTPLKLDEGTDVNALFEYVNATFGELYEFVVEFANGDVVHGGHSTTRSLHAWDECTQREYASGTHARLLSSEKPRHPPLRPPPG